ncbi:hypothetical protein [Nostoc sp.]|uniref:hypothetical protein n=1 Tax=Nostoc sp. TaxID=1180 RepID=UPI002FF4F735
MQFLATWKKEISGLADNLILRGGGEAGEQGSKGAEENGTKKSSKPYSILKLLNIVGTGQAIILNEVLRSLMKFVPGYARSVVEMPVAVNYAMPNSRQCKDVGVVQKIFR